MSISPLTNSTPSNPSVSPDAPDGAVFMANAAQNRLCEQLVVEAVAAFASIQGRIERLRRMTPEQARQELTRRNSNEFMEKLMDFAEGIAKALVLFRNVQRAVTP